MSYDQVRDGEQLRLLNLDQFVADFNPGAPTILFLPGGMASALLQTGQSFTTQTHPPYVYETEWVSCATFDGGADLLRMDGSEDANLHLTVPQRVIGFMGISPYRNFEAWCRQRTVPFNYLLLSWDWRRPVDEAVTFIAQTVLPTLRASILQYCGIDFLTTEYYFVSHSFGGLVLKRLLDDEGIFIDNLRRAIAVASPFYGYGGSQHFYFAGFSYLNPFYSRRDLATVIGSMLGPYALMFLDLATYATVGAQLKADPDFPLLGYPSVDAANPALNVDPYAYDATRYPGGWVSAAALTKAAKTRAAIAAPLPPATAAKLYFVRGVRTAGSQAVNDTIVQQQWQRINSGFDPDSSPDPILNPGSTMGPGDGTIPAWSARLVGAAVDHVKTVKGDIDHMTMMDDPIVQKQIAPLIDGAPQSELLFDLVRGSQELWEPTAEREALLAVLSTLAAVPSLRERRRALQAVPPDRMRMLARRFIRDLPNPPAAFGERLGAVPTP